MSVFFVRKVVIPVDSGSYDIRTGYDEYIYTDYCKNSLNKKLAQKAVAITTRASKIMVKYCIRMEKMIV